MKIIGILLIAFAIADFAGGYAGIDVWADYIGVQLPDIVWRFSAMIEGAIGYALFSYGSADEEQADPGAPTGE